MRRCFPLLVLLLLVPLFGQDSSALINQALDKPVSLQLDGILPDVLKTIEQKTGVRIVPTRSVYELLPWGEQTNITAKIENQTLRKALEAITRKLGLTFDVARFDVELKPMPALQRLGRRATVAELQALDLLSSTPAGLSADHPTVQQLVDAVDQKLAGIKSPSIAVELRAGDPANPQGGSIKLDRPVNVPRNATLEEALESLAKETDATWYPWGKNIVVVPKEEQVRMALTKPITARFNGMELGEVLTRLEQASGVQFTIEPGAIQRVPPEFRTVRIELQNATIRNVLDNIRGLTGLDYVVKPDGVYVWNQNANPAAGGRGNNDPVVATVQIDGGLQLFLRESDLPADLKEYFAQKKKTEFENVRKMMRQEGFTPTTRPATQEAQKDKEL